MNEVAIIASCASIRTVVVAAWDGAIITRFYQLIRVLCIDLLFCCHLLLLLILRFELISLQQKILSFEFVEFLIGQLNELSMG